MAGFIDEVVLPAEYEIGERPFFEIVREVQAKARDQGLWCPFVPKEWGGMGLGHLANALVQIEVGRSFSYLGAWALNCMGPQDATMLTLIEHGTEAEVPPPGARSGTRTRCVVRDHAGDTGVWNCDLGCTGPPDSARTLDAVTPSPTRSTT